MSAPWISGGRVSGRVLERHLSATLLSGPLEERAVRVAVRCARVWRHVTETLGPSSGAGAVWSHLVAPCVETFGLTAGEPQRRQVGPLTVRVATTDAPAGRVALVALPWGVSQAGLQRLLVRLGAEMGARWVSACDGVAWRWHEVGQPYAREHVCVDLQQAAYDARVWQALWLLGGVPGGGRGASRARSTLDRLVTESASQSSGHAAALRDGVAETLADLARRVPAARDAHVSQVFQWLFLFFAEASHLLPVRHPAYRRSYSLTSLARETSRHGAAPVGLHDSTAAIARAGREGLALGSVSLAALNGPLFSDLPLARHRPRLADATLESMLRRLTHGARKGHEQAIDFTELGVEHLGSIYEHLMAPDSPGNGPAWMRKRTGAFYTPRTLADRLVHRTLDPLVRDASADQILALRIVDPAMGSGALLASALRYLVAAVEAAWVREGRGGPLDVPVRERESLPRRIAEQCLHGVDVNPLAVQVARLSIWLLSLAPDRPLTWLDAHLRTGNSLVGASPALVLARAPVPGRPTRRHDAGQLTLFDLSRWHHEAAEIAPLLRALAARPTDSAEDARDKSRAFHALRERDGLAGWRTRADAWCGAAMDERVASPALWRSADDVLRRDGRGPTPAAVSSCVDRWTTLARAQGCLHWGLEFPDVFDEGLGGFDAVVANPPWEMLRSDLGTGPERDQQRGDVGPLLRFVRRSGIYRDSRGHVNTYQLFVERMGHLLRPGGRLGCLLPGSVLADHGAAPLRRRLLDDVAIDRVSILGNRDGLFPIHRSMRIVCLTGTAGARTDALLVDRGDAEAPPCGPAAERGDADGSRRAVPHLMSRALLERASGEALAIPHLPSPGDVGLLDRLTRWPRLGAEWSLQFGRELNATDDRARFTPGSGRDSLVVVEGKHLRGFAVVAPSDGPWIHPDEATKALPTQPWRRWRLAYRDVSSPTNSRSLIAALLPPGCVSTHTIFCLRSQTTLRTQLYLCGMLNSLVADWFVRRYLGAHVTTRLMALVPVPLVAATDPRRRRVVRLTLRLMREPDDEDAAAALQLTAAAIYALDADDRVRVADDFPRLPSSVRAAFVRPHR